MTTNQLRALLKAAGLSQRGAAKLLEIDERTMRRYCAGSQAVPKRVEYALMYVAQRIETREPNNH
jgi:transcriptional regulator with XRE-family HTH domain